MHGGEIALYVIHLGHHRLLSHSERVEIYTFESALYCVIVAYEYFIVHFEIVILSVNIKFHLYISAGIGGMEFRQFLEAEFSIQSYGRFQASIAFKKKPYGP